jgi:hypothetical protein
LKNPTLQKPPEKIEKKGGVSLGFEGGIWRWEKIVIIRVISKIPGKKNRANPSENLLRLWA